VGCHTLPVHAQPQRFLCPTIPEACLPGEGMVWWGYAAFADVAPLGDAGQGLSGRDVTAGVSGGWVRCSYLGNA
jgi:hypothetical protein